MKHKYLSCIKLDLLCITATTVTLQHTQSSPPVVLESHTVMSEQLGSDLRLVFINCICLALHSHGERGEILQKEHGMGLRGRLTSRWNGAVAKAGVQISQHCVELKVQLLKGRRRGKKDVRVVD